MDDAKLSNTTCFYHENPQNASPVAVDLDLLKKPAGILKLLSMDTQLADGGREAGMLRVRELSTDPIWRLEDLVKRPRKERCPDCQQREQRAVEWHEGACGPVMDINVEPGEACGIRAPPAIGRVPVLLSLSG